MDLFKNLYLDVKATLNDTDFEKDTLSSEFYIEDTLNRIRDLNEICTDILLIYNQDKPLKDVLFDLLDYLEDIV